MHNGGLGGWKQIKRRLGQRLADKWFLGVNGGTDSEWAFALFLDTLERMGCDPSSQPENGFGPTVLRKAMLKTIALINELIDDIPESVVHDENVDTRSLLNFAVSDGYTIICTRYVGSSHDEAASLYYSSGTLWETRTPEPTNRDYQMERSDKGADVVLVASEPLTFERGMFSSPISNHRNQVLTSYLRKLGKRTNKLNPHNPQPDRHGTPHHGPVLRPQPLPQTIHRLRQSQGPGRQRKGNGQAHPSHPRRLASHRYRRITTPSPN